MLFGVELKKRGFALACAILILVLAALAFVSFYIGRYSGLAPVDVIKILLHQSFGLFEETWNSMSVSVVMELRLPRIVGSIMVGAALAASGATFQTLFSNPMASPDTLGVSSGAGFGACLGILLGWTSGVVQVSAFAVGCIAVIAVYLLSAALARGSNMTLVLVLTGMVMSSFFSALISVLKYVADPMDQLPSITYWLMGSFSATTLENDSVFLVFLLLGIVPLMLLRWKMNLLSLSDIEAKAMGVDIRLIRLVAIVAATMLTGASVALAGGIGWVGLVVPHMARIVAGNDYRRVLPLSCLIGAIFLLAMDDISRAAFGFEIPIGILTSLVGVPLFFAIAVKYRKRGFGND